MRGLPCAFIAPFCQIFVAIFCTNEAVVDLLGFLFRPQTMHVMNKLNGSFLFQIPPLFLSCLIQLFVLSYKEISGKK